MLTFLVRFEQEVHSKVDAEVQKRSSTQSVSSSKGFSGMCNKAGTSTLGYNEK